MSPVAEGEKTDDGDATLVLALPATPAADAAEAARGFATRF